MSKPCLPIRCEQILVDPVRLYFQQAVVQSSLFSVLTYACSSSKFYETLCKTCSFEMSLFYISRDSML